VPLGSPGAYSTFTHLIEVDERVEISEIDAGEARCTGKPSPSSPVGAVVKLRRGRSRAITGSAHGYGQDGDVGDVIAGIRENLVGLLSSERFEALDMSDHGLVARQTSGWLRLQPPGATPMSQKDPARERTVLGSAARLARGAPRAGGFGLGDSAVELRLAEEPQEDKWQPVAAEASRLRFRIG